MLRQVVVVVVVAAAGCIVPDKHEASAPSDAAVTVIRDAPSTADAAVPDTTAPTLVDVNPAPGASWRHSPIHLTFGEPLDAASVLATTVTATFKDDPVTATITFEPPQAVVIKVGHLSKNAGLLELTVSATIADLAGNAIAAPLQFSAALEAQ